MVLLKLKRLNFIKKLASKLNSNLPKNNEVSIKSVIKRFSIHLVFLFIIGIVVYPISMFDGLNPITQTFRDLTFSDLYYSKIRKGTVSDTSSKQIILVNIEDGEKIETRQKIGQFLQKIHSDSSFEPKVIGIDVSFKGYSGNKYVDSLLSANLKRKNIVSNCDLHIDGEICYCEGSNKYFMTSHEGFSNQWIEEDRPLTERYFKPQHYFSKDSVINHFSLAIVKEYNEEVYKNYIDNINPNAKQLINFRGSYQQNNIYSIEDTSNLFLLKDKIVLIGFYEFDGSGKIKYTEDTHWVPTNPFYFGRSAPNMYGLEIQAHIISSIIHNDSITHYRVLNVILQIFFSLMIYFLILRFYMKNQTKFTFSKLFIQVFTIVGLIVLSVLQIHWFNVYLDYTVITYAAFLSAELVGITEGLVERYYFRVKSIFKTKKNAES